MKTAVLTAIRLNVFFLFLSGSAVFAESAAPRLPAPIVEALSANGQLEPIEIAWVNQPLTDRPALVVAKELRMDIAHFDASTDSFAWQGVMVHTRSESRPRRGICEINSDGRILSSATSGAAGGRASFHKDLIADLVKEDEKKPYWQKSTWLGADFLTNCGLRPPSSPDEMIHGLGQSEILWLLDNGAKLSACDETLDQGHRAFRVAIEAIDPLRANEELITRPQLDVLMSALAPDWRGVLLDRWKNSRELPTLRQYIFFLDPEHGYAVSRREERSANRLMQETTNSEFEKVAGRSVWLPRKSRTEYYWFSTSPTFSERPLFSQLIKVTELSSHRISDKMFQLDYRSPGTTVTDATVKGEPFVYVIPADGENSDHTSYDNKYSLLSDMSIGEHHVRNTRVLVVVLVGTVFLLIRIAHRNRATLRR